MVSDRLCGHLSTALMAAHFPSPGSVIAETLRTSFGDIKLTKGIPVNVKVAQQLFKQSDFQRAVQAYVWALPIDGFAQWQSQRRTVLERWIPTKAWFAYFRLYVYCNHSLTARLRLQILSWSNNGK